MKILSLGNPFGGKDFALFFSRVTINRSCLQESETNQPMICPGNSRLCMRFMTSFLIAFLGAATALSNSNRFQLAPLFQDNMVLQRLSQVPIWGKGTPHTKVVVKGSWGKKNTTIVGPDSVWSVKLPTPKAGGPYEVLVLHEDSSVVLRNVLIGEVWLCSGQSNMEMPLEGWPPSDTINDFAAEIEHAQFPTIRLFNVQRNYSASPVGACSGTWIECSPSTVRSFSATAFFFGRKLHEALNVPIGLIEAAWGGTPIESWMSKQALDRFQEFAQTLKTIDICRDSLDIQNRWLSHFPTVNVTSLDAQRKWEGLQFQDDSCSARAWADSAWNEMNLPTLWERTSLGEFDGVVWFRKRVEIPYDWTGKSLHLHLGPIDDMDETYVNGEKVGGMMKEGFWKTERVYTIPDSVVRDSTMEIAIRVIDIQGGGGIWGDEKSMYISSDSSALLVSIDGAWKYLPVAKYRSGIFWTFGARDDQCKNRPKLPFDFTAYSPTALFNGMISPLLPFTIRGVIWYQGESNANNAALYKKTFPSLIADWRKAWRSGEFPFYYVQLAPYTYDPPTESQYLREAQLQTLTVKNSGMAVTLDIGNPDNIHPSNKSDVGLRLAFWALAKTYGKQVPFSGPLYESMKIVKEKIVLSFTNVDGGLVLRKRYGNHNIMIAGKDMVFKIADARIEGKTLVVSHPEIPVPVAVRYAWHNADEGTLFNKKGLPAPSFRTDAW